jgi:NADH:ubiquinone oxidoreductase subunit 2 (subunit N)
MSAVSLYYYLSVLRRVMEEPKQIGTYEKLEPGAAIAIFMTAAAVVVLGISPSLLLSPLAQALQGMVP